MTGGSPEPSVTAGDRWCACATAVARTEREDPPAAPAVRRFCSAALHADLGLRAEAALFTMRSCTGPGEAEVI